MSAPEIPHISLPELISRYQVVLLDAFGVLVDGAGALPHAPRLLAEIARQQKPLLVVTNDASRLPATVAERFRRVGLDIDADRILTSGLLLEPYFAERGLHGARTMVLGPADSAAYVRAAGGQVVPIEARGACDVLAVCDDAGYPFLPAIEDALSMLFRHFDRGDAVELVLPNPDIIYPKKQGDYGFTSGAVALLLEAALARRYPGRELCFTRLGKPHTPIFEQARRRAGTDHMIMIGDQLETDIAGACAAGIDSALLLSGVSTWNPPAHLDAGAPAVTRIVPTYLLELP